MSQKITLTAEERSLLEKLTVKQLQLLRDIAGAGKIETVVAVLDKLVSFDRDAFLTENNINEKVILRKHALFQGGLILGRKFLRVVKSAEHELAKREEERKKRKQGKYKEDLA